MMKSVCKFLLAFLLLALFGANAWAAVCSSRNGGGNWSTASIWSCGRVPATGDSARITSGNPVTLNQNATILGVTIDTGGTLTADNNSRRLTLTDTPSFTVAAGGTFNPGNSTVAVSRLATTTLTSGNVTFYNLELAPALGNSNQTYGFGAAAVTINGNLTINPSRSSGQTRSLTVNLGGALTVLGLTTVQASGDRSAAILDTTTSNRSLTSGRLTVGAAGTLNANGSTITLNGSAGPLLTLGGTLNVGTSTFLMTSPASVALNAGNAPAFYNLTLNMAGQTGTLGTDATVSNTLSLLNGSLAVGARTLTLAGNAISGNPNNLSTTGSSALVFSGGASGVILPASVAQVGNLTINNANGVTMQGDTAVNGILALTSGMLNTGASTLSASVANCPAGITRGSGHVNGKLQLRFAAGSTSCTFPVGSASAYAPITVSKGSGTNAGLLTGGTVGAEHPDINDSSIDPTKDVNRYWTLSGDTIGAASYNASFTFVAGDVDTGATPASFALGKFADGIWTSPVPVTASATSTASSAIPGPLLNAAFAAGQSSFVCAVPSGMPSTMTCVCDNFGRSTLNPSTIYGGNWALSSSSGSFGTPKIVNSGFLRMTDNSANVATAATMPGIFPAAGNLITVDFKHFAYNGSGADGIALTLSDATQTPIPGAYGGSLGYAQKNNASCASPPCNGFVGGWVGIGIDEFGNYSSATEGRNGGIGTRADAVAVRGSGSGLTGYPYLAGTGTLSPGVDNAGSSSPSYGHAYRVMVDARCYQRNTASSEITCNNPGLAKRTQVSVYRDTTGTGNFTTTNRIINFDAYSANPSQANVPSNWKLSFTGSTGSNSNVHEIQGLKICAQTIVPPAGYRIQVDNLTPSTCGTPAGSPSSPIVTVTALDTNGGIVSDYNKTVTLSATLANGSAASVTWRKVGASSNLSGNQYTFTAEDNGTAQFYLSSVNAQSVYVTVTENGGGIATSFESPVVFSGAAFNITNIDALGGDAGGGVIAGRNHLMQITRTNGCSVNTTYTGNKTLDGWYTPALEHPDGAAAPAICSTNAGGTCFDSAGNNSTGACTTLSIAPPTISSSSNFMPLLNFVNGVARFCVKTADVGKYSVSLRDDTASTAVNGSSGTLTARPFAVAVSEVKGANNNPAANTPGGGVIGIAGANFQATVGGYLWSRAADANGNGLPDDGVAFSTLTGGGLAPHYADEVGLVATAFAPAPPSGPTPENIGGPVVISSNGQNTILSLSYPEVGAFTLGAIPASGYLNSGVNLAGRVAIYAKPGSAETPTAWVGRFRPSHFAVVGTGTVGNRADLSCGAGSSFTYMGEPLQLGFSIEARNAAGMLVRNYRTDGGWAKLATPSAGGWTATGAGGMGLWAVATEYQPPGSPSGSNCRAVFANSAGTNTIFSCAPGTPPAALARAAGARVQVTSGAPINWDEGSTTVSVETVLHRADTPDGPYASLRFGVLPTDADGVTLQAASLNLNTDSTAGNDRAEVADTEVRFGRLRMSNAIGSDRAPMLIPLQLQFWNGSQFVLNTDDSCTGLAPANLGVSYPTPTVLGAGHLPASPLTLVPSPVANGVGSIRIARPNAPLTGAASMVICADLGPDSAPGPGCSAASPLSMPWLQGQWSANSPYDDDPAARASFGVYRGAPIIYMRENY